MKNITLVCAAGMSTSMLTKKMKEEAAKQGIEVSIEAMPEAAFKKSNKETDVLLLGPQISYLYEDLKKQFQPKGVKVQVIDMMDYGMMNGKKVLENALSLMD